MTRKKSNKADISESSQTHGKVTKPLKKATGKKSSKENKSNNQADNSNKSKKRKWPLSRKQKQPQAYTSVKNRKSAKNNTKS